MDLQGNNNILKTKRLILRPWREEDLEPFANLTADPRVMEYFPSTLNRQESDRLAKRLMELIEEQGFGFWAVTVPGYADFIGFIGLNPVNFSTPFTPAVEIGWRLAYDYWGLGFATEGAQMALNYGFTVLNLDEIVSFTTLTNQRSQRVMQKIGMHYNPKDNFDHPQIPEGHPLRRHVLYRLKKTEWHY